MCLACDDDGMDAARWARWSFGRFWRSVSGLWIVIFFNLLFPFFPCFLCFAHFRYLYHHLIPFHSDLPTYLLNLIPSLGG